MGTFATETVSVRFVEFQYLGEGLGNVIASFDGQEFTFAPNRTHRGAAVSRPEYDRFIEQIVTGNDFDADDDQNIGAAERGAALRVTMASAYAAAYWTGSGGRC